MFDLKIHAKKGKKGRNSKKVYMMYKKSQKVDNSKWFEREKENEFVNRQFAENLNLTQIREHVSKTYKPRNLQKFPTSSNIIIAGIYAVQYKY